MQKKMYQKKTDACLEPELTDLSSHTNLTQKGQISDSKGVVWFADRLYTLYTFWEKKEEKQNKIFIFDFLDCEKD